MNKEERMQCGRKLKSSSEEVRENNQRKRKMEEEEEEEEEKEEEKEEEVLTIVLKGVIYISLHQDETPHFSRYQVIDQQHTLPHLSIPSYSTSSSSSSSSSSSLPPSHDLGTETIIV